MITYCSIKRSDDQLRFQLYQRQFRARRWAGVEGASLCSSACRPHVSNRNDLRDLTESRNIIWV